MHGEQMSFCSMVSGCRSTVSSTGANWPQRNILEDTLLSTVSVSPGSSAVSESSAVSPQALGIKWSTTFTGSFFSRLKAETQTASLGTHMLYPYVSMTILLLMLC